MEELSYCDESSRIELISALAERLKLGSEKRFDQKAFNVAINMTIRQIVQNKGQMHITDEGVTYPDRQPDTWKFGVEDVDEVIREAITQTNLNQQIALERKEAEKSAPSLANVMRESPAREMYEKCQSVRHKLPAHEMIGEFWQSDTHFVHVFRSTDSPPQYYLRCVRNKFFLRKLDTPQDFVSLADGKTCAVVKYVVLRNYQWDTVGYVVEGSDPIFGVPVVWSRFSHDELETDALRFLESAEMSF